MTMRPLRGLWLAPLAGLTVLAGLACGGISDSRDLTPAEQALVLDPEELVERLGADADPASTPVSCRYTRVFSNAGWRCSKSEVGGWSMESSVKSFVMESDTARSLPDDIRFESKILSNNGYEVTPVDDAWSWGDDRDCRSLRKDGAPAGILCMGRKGLYIVKLEVKGLPVEGAGVVDRLLEPELAALESWDPDAE